MGYMGILLYYTQSHILSPKWGLYPVATWAVYFIVGTAAALE